MDWSTDGTETWTTTSRYDDGIYRASSSSRGKNEFSRVLIAINFSGLFTTKKDPGTTKAVTEEQQQQKTDYSLLTHITLTRNELAPNSNTRDQWRFLLETFVTAISAISQKASYF